MTKPRLMAILNVTPDSFHAAARHLDPALAIAQGQKFWADGADIIDIGGESTRPNASYVSVEEELERVLPVVTALLESVPIPLSIDTRKPQVAERCLEAGVHFLNDIGGFRDPAMRELAVAWDVDICVMHMQGDPTTMQKNPDYPDGVVDTLMRWFDEQITLLVKSGAKESHIILDPGIGFGKTVANNVEILQNLPRLKTMGYPLLLGVSRKSFLSRLLSKPTDQLLAATIAVSVLAQKSGVDILRVHDVAEHRGVIDLVEILTIKGLESAGNLATAFGER